MEEKDNRPASAPGIKVKVEILDPDELRGCLVFLVLPLVMLVDGICLSSLWGWFLTPLGLPKIGVAHGTGIMLLKKFFTFGSTTETLKKSYIILTINMKIALMVVGYITYRLMIR